MGKYVVKLFEKSTDFLKYSFVFDEFEQVSDFVQMALWAHRPSVNEKGENNTLNITIEREDN